MSKCVWCNNQSNKVLEINNVDVNICSVRCELEYLEAIKEGKITAPEMGFIESSIRGIIGLGVFAFIIYVILKVIFG